MTREERPSYARRAAQLLRDARQESPAEVPVDRQGLEAAVAAALVANARRRRLVKMAGYASAAAAVLLIGGGAWQWRRMGELSAAAYVFTLLDDPGRVDDGTSLDGKSAPALRRGMELPPGIRLAAPSQSEVQLGTAAGTSITLEPTASLTVKESSDMQRFVLHGGAVRVRVAPLGAGRRFCIDTDAAEIEVHGTVFRVEVMAADSVCADRERTSVTVSEGVVTVRSRTDEVRLTPGSRWQSTCASPVPAVQVQRVPAAPARAGALRRGPGMAPGEPVADEPVPSSVLAAQNKLFAEALGARKEGRSADAVALFDRLLAEHPRSPLAESATVHRMKVLASSDRVTGAHAASEYLRQYPDGYARGDAQRIINDDGRPAGP